MFSSGHDGAIIVWGSGGAVYDGINVRICTNFVGLRYFEKVLKSQIRINR